MCSTIVLSSRKGDSDVDYERSSYEQVLSGTISRTVDTMFATVISTPNLVSASTV
jgi:hypothetical protein